MSKKIKPFGSHFYGGSEEIRTPDKFYPIPAFQASALDHYATLPYVIIIDSEEVFVNI